VNLGGIASIGIFIYTIYTIRKVKIT